MWVTGQMHTYKQTSLCVVSTFVSILGSYSTNGLLHSYFFPPSPNVGFADICQTPRIVFVQ